LEIEQMNSFETQ